MNGLDHYKISIRRRIGNDEVAETCAKIIDYLASLPKEELCSISFMTLCIAAGEKELNSNALRAISILRNQRPRTLDTRYYLIDGDEEYEVPVQEARAALEDGILVDKYGRTIENVGDKLFPYFSASDEFFELKSATNV